VPTQTQLRREARKRREFLYTKSLEQKEQQIWQRKQAVRDLLAKGKQAPRGHGAGERELKMDAAQDGERARSHGTRWERAR
jgi:U3 small nucleolar ribonucleoprotein protein IMP4